MKHAWSILNLYIFSDIKESSRGWVIDIHRTTHRRRWSLDDEPLIVPITFFSGDEYWRWSLLLQWEPNLNQTLVLREQPPKIVSLLVFVILHNFLILILCGQLLIFITFHHCFLSTVYARACYLMTWLLRQLHHSI